MAMAATALTGCRGGRVGGRTLHFDDPLPARDDDAPGGAAAMPSGFSLHGYAHAGLVDGARGPVDAAAERPHLYPAAQASGEPSASPRILFGGLRAQLRDLAAANAPHLLLAPGAAWEGDDPLFLSAPWAEDSDAMDDTAPTAAPPHDTARYAPLLRLEAPPVAILSAAAHSERGGPLRPAHDDLEQDLDVAWPVGGAHSHAARPRVAESPLQRGHGPPVDDLDVAFAL
jgi:hypothetical protein